MICKNLSLKYPVRSTYSQTFHDKSHTAASFLSSFYLPLVTNPHNKGHICLLRSHNCPKKAGLSSSPELKLPGSFLGKHFILDGFQNDSCHLSWVGETKLYKKSRGKVTFSCLQYPFCLFVNSTVQNKAGYGKQGSTTGLQNKSSSHIFPNPDQSSLDKEQFSSLLSNAMLLIQHFCCVLCLYLLHVPSKVMEICSGQKHMAVW